jgi:hypothetical protein
METLCIFYDNLVYFTAIGNILCPFGIFCVHLVYFPPFWYFGPRKIWQPWYRRGHLSSHFDKFQFADPAEKRATSRSLQQGCKICVSKIWYISEGIGMDIFGISCGHLIY